MSSATIEPVSRGRAMPRLGTRLGFAHGFVAVVALALLLRVVLVLATPHYVPRTDAADYDRIAASFARSGHFPSSLLVPTGGPTALRPPLFPVSLGIVYKLVGVGSQATRWEAGRLFEAALGAVTVALICLIALRLWGRRAALLSGALAAVYPPLVLVGSSLMTESLFVPLVLAAVLAALVSRESNHNGRWAPLVGVLIGLGALTRGNGIVLVLPIGFLVWSRRPRLTLRSVAAPIALVLATLLVLVPWTVRNENAFGEFVPVTTETGYVLGGTFNSFAAHRTDFPAMWLPPVADAHVVLVRHPRLNEAQLSDRLNTLGLDYARAHPGYVLKAFWWNGLRLLNLTGTRFERWNAAYDAYPGWLAGVSVYAFWLAGVLALGGLATAAARRAPWAFWACPLLICLSTVFTGGGTRYRSPADPFVIMLAALALLAAWQWLAAGGHRGVQRRMRVPSAAG